jgi:hypothetical protein
MNTRQKQSQVLLLAEVKIVIDSQRQGRIQTDASDANASGKIEKS